MSDITECNDSHCLNCEYCYRFTVKASQCQSYFMESPFHNGYCREFCPIEKHALTYEINEDAMFIRGEHGVAKIFPISKGHACVVTTFIFTFDKISTDVEELVAFAEFILY